MPSSPASTGTTAGDLQALAGRYDLALEAALRVDLDRCRVLIDEAGVLLQVLPPAADDSADERRLRLAARASYERVGAALQAALVTTNADLEKVRQGRRALRGYIDPTRGLGDHVESRG